MTQPVSPPTTTPPRRRFTRRFDQARATLVLLLASAGMLGYSAVQASRPHPGFGPPVAASHTPQAAGTTPNGEGQP